MCPTVNKSLTLQSHPKRGMQVGVTPAAPGAPCTGDEQPPPPPADAVAAAPLAVPSPLPVSVVADDGAGRNWRLNPARCRGGWKVSSA